MVQHIMNCLSSKTNIYLVKGYNKQSNISLVCILPKIQKTDTLLLDSQNTLVVLHAEKLVSLFINHLWYGPTYN